MTRSTSQPPSARELVELFFQAATQAWEPWIRAEKGRWALALEHVNRQGRFESTSTDNMSGLFLASGMFDTPRVIGEITFGDREYFINTVVGPVRGGAQYGLWEWADAVGRSDVVPRNTDFVTQPDRLQTIITEMAAGVRLLSDHIARADRAVIDRMEGARALVRAAWDAELRELEHAGTVRSANEAFRMKEWNRVITLLTSVGDRLSPAEEAKLRYARAQVE